MSLDMEAYYYSFEPTGVEAVDEVLAAVARAGAESHHTNGWSDPEEWLDGRSQAYMIQQAANRCAQYVRDVEAQVRATVARDIDDVGDVDLQDVHVWREAARIARGDGHE